MIRQRERAPLLRSFFLLAGIRDVRLPGVGFTFALLSGILSRPSSPFSSLPPELDVPLPLVLCPFPEVS